MVRWSVGIDPGLSVCTAMVLLKDDVPLAAVGVQGARPEQFTLVQRSRAISNTMRNRLVQWINEHKMTELDVMIELPFLRKTPVQNVANVQGLMASQTLHAMLVAMLCELANMHADKVRIRYGAIYPNTAKAVLTGNGNASKAEMVSFSAWEYRPDVTMREHLADAQGIGTCAPQMEGLCDEYIPSLALTYDDSRIGKGRVWKHKPGE